MKRKVIFINSSHHVLLDKLSEVGFECIIADDMNYDKIIEIIGEYSGVIINSRINIDRQFLDKAVKLKFIGRLGSGMESIDVNYALKKGVKCYNSPEGNRDAVAEHAVGMLLSLMNKIHVANNDVRNRIWNREANRGVELMGKTIAIIGYGNTGSAFARRLKGFDVNVIAYDKYKKCFSDSFATECGLEQIFDEADIVSLHIPLNEETFYMVDGNFIDRFKKSFWLINTSRGKIVNTYDLVEGLKNGKIEGTALDVLEYEDISFEKISISQLPQPMQYIISAPNVLLTPHVAGWTIESKYRLAKILADKIINDFKDAAGEIS